MDTTLINSIDWESLNHAYGKATNGPKELVNLLSENEDDRDDAVNDFLYSSAYHQGTVYSCTPSVMRCVIHIIKHEDITTLETIGAPLIRELFHFLSICGINWKTHPKIAEALYEGRKIYKEYLSFSDPNTVNSAKELINFCNEYASS